MPVPQPRLAGKLRSFTIRTLIRTTTSRLVRVNLTSRSSTEFRDPGRWIYLTVLEGELSASIAGGTPHEMLAGNRLGAPPGNSVGVLNPLRTACVFTVLYVDNTEVDA